MNYHDITYPDMNNGDGLRVVLWLSGCSHRCKGCQNPQTWDINSGIPFDELAKEEFFRELDKDYISGLTLTGGDPLYEGNLYDILNLVNEVNKQYNITQHIDKFRTRNNNILNQDNNEIYLSLPNKSIWLYSGYKVEKVYNNQFILSPSANDIANIEPDYIVFNERTNDKLRNDIISKCTVMVDGQYMENKRDISLQWRGSSNQRVIDIQQSLKEGEVVLWKS